MCSTGGCSEEHLPSVLDNHVVPRKEKDTNKEEAGMSDHIVI